MAKRYDVVIVGGGNAGFGVSKVLVDSGKSIAFVEEASFGGTCPNRGCTPKKVLVAAGNSLHEIELAKKHHIEVGAPNLNWEALINRKNEMIDFIPNAMQEVATKRGDVFLGKARFVNEDTIEVNGERITGENIVIATGSIPRPISVSGAEYMITSDQILDDPKQPEEVVFIGGGVIAMEFGHLYARAGTKVTVLEMLPQLLPRLDSGAIKALKAESERIGMNFFTSANIQSIEKLEEKYRVSFIHGGDNHEIYADKVINAAGRVANIEALNTESANIKKEGFRIETNEYMQSVSNSKIWVAGDSLTGAPQLSPIATEEGMAVGHNILNGPCRTIDYSVLPIAVHTVPALASIGLSEEDARKKNIDIEVTESDMSQWFSGKSYAETVAYAKTIVDKKTGLFVGVHIVGHKGEELINLYSLAMEFKITAQQLKKSRFSYPTFTSDVKNI